MPLIVNKEEEKNKILKAFESCIEEKPIFQISLRDIAKKANMSHPKLLNYFKNKDELIFSYCDYIKCFMSQHCELWFNSHDPKNYKNKKNYMDAFMEYVANGTENEKRPIATVQTYVLAKYNSKVEQMIIDEFFQWKSLMKKCLQNVFGDEATDKDSEYMMILIAGVFICKYNKVLSSSISNHLMSASNLFQK